ncbi:MAG TPA: DUF1460 domain-containing protein [Acidobacteriota bacterium]|nr:DUF1460 domain-containing protein [Acidobacteriota bacterium]
MNTGTWNIRTDYEPERLATLLAAAPAERPCGERIRRLCAALAGAPYRTAPLGGGPGQPEVLTVSLDAFDCVTFLETVMALARSADEAEFLDHLRLIRYSGGRVAWASRRHYMSRWLEENAAEGRVAPLPHPAGRTPREWTRHLAVVPGLPPATAAVRGWPKQAVATFRRVVCDGDLACFVSTRRGLDYFHVGILLAEAGGPMLVHAARSAGNVVRTPLATFLAAHRMSGVTLARPWPELPRPAEPNGGTV